MRKRNPPGNIGTQAPEQLRMFSLPRTMLHYCTFNLSRLNFLVMPSQSDISKMSQSQLRYEEANYFLEQFIQHLSPDSYFHIVAYLDAFLTCFVSIEELIKKKKKTKLNEQPIFKFLKAARNITTHIFIIASISEERPFQLNYVRSHFEPGGGGYASAQVNISIKKFRARFEKDLADLKRKRAKNIFKLVLNYLKDLICPNRKGYKKTLELALIYLKDLENRPETLQGKLDIAKVAQEGLDTVANLLSLSKATQSS